MTCTAAPAATLPGTLVEVFGAGVLISGDSGRGKSELALALVDRGHALVADDAIELALSGGRLHGRAPQLTAGLLALRDIGIIDIGAHYGTGALRESTTLELELCLSAEPPRQLARWRQRPIMGVSLWGVELSIADTRPLPLLAEVAVRELRHRRHGVDSQTRFIAAQARAAKETA